MEDSDSVYEDQDIFLAENDNCLETPMIVEEKTGGGVSKSCHGKSRYPKKLSELNSLE